MRAGLITETIWLGAAIQEAWIYTGEVEEVQKCFVPALEHAMPRGLSARSNAVLASANTRVLSVADREKKHWWTSMF